MSGIYGQFCGSKVYGCMPITLKMQLTDNRIFVSVFNRLVATEADSPVITLTENASAWDAHDTRVCANIAGHGLHCKLTSLTGPWVTRVGVVSWASPARTRRSGRGCSGAARTLGRPGRTARA